MLFDYLKSIISTKVPCEQLDEYVPYLITRWLSFSSPKVVSALNESVNSLNTLTKEQHYKLLMGLFPKYKYFSKINYIKKTTVNKNNKEDEQKTQLIAQNLEMSKREVLQLQKMVDFLNITSK
jgi:hypothetical protein